MMDLYRLKGHDLFDLSCPVTPTTRSVAKKQQVMTMLHLRNVASTQHNVLQTILLRITITIRV